MTVQEIIQKIEDAEARERSRRLVVTEPLLKFEMINYLSDSFDKDDSTLNKDGYYAMMGGIPTFINTTNWVTFTMPIATTESAIAKFVRFSLNGGELFVITKTDDTKEYVNVPNTINNPMDFSIQLPENTEYIEVSYLLQPSPTPIQIVFEIEVERFQYVNVTPYVSNWPIIAAEQTRKDFSGVTIEVTNPFEITGLARDLFVQMVIDSGVYARAGMNIYKRRDISNDYDIVREMEVDFLTYEESDDNVSFAVIKNDLQEIIKTGQSTKYDIPVSSITDSKKWNYVDRMDLLNNANYTLPVTEEPITNTDESSSDVYLPMAFTNAELTPNKINNEIDLRGQSLLPLSSDNFEYFFRTYNPINIDSLRLKFSITIGVNNSNADARPFRLFIYKRNISQLTLIWNSDPINVNSGESVINFDIDDTVNNISLVENDVVYLSAGLTGIFRVYWVQYTEFSIFSLTWKSKANPITGIDLIKPDVLLQTYLNRISGISGRFNAIIEWDETFSPMICAAETLSNYPIPVLHGSMKDLMSWLKVLGYEYSYEGRTMLYKRRDEFFKKDVTAIELNENEISKLRKISNEDVAYTSVQIGYKKEDYNESANGKLEVNAQFDYSTGFFNQTENILSLISPYRSDSIGVEILLNKRGERITDNSSDNDIFALQMQENEDEYVYSEENKMQADNIFLYNGSLCPRFLVERNKTIIGIISNNLKFTGTEGYRQALIDGEDIIYSDVSITDKLYEPFIYIFNVGSHLDMPEESVRDGIVKFTYKGVQKTGFINDVQKYFREQEGEWQLNMVE